MFKYLGFLDQKHVRAVRSFLGGEQPPPPLRDVTAAAFWPYSLEGVGLRQLTQVPYEKLAKLASPSTPPKEQQGGNSHICG